MVELSGTNQQNAEGIFRLTYSVGAAAQSKLFAALQMNLRVVIVLDCEFAQPQYRPACSIARICVKPGRQSEIASG